MAVECFKGHGDRYDGVTIDSVQEPCESGTFAQRLEASLEQWIKQKRRGIWFKVHIPQAEWVPVLAKQDFKFHHARDQYVMMYRWLPSNEECNIPPYAHTNLGIGAFVFNEETNEVLVIKEKHTIGSPTWKLPGGYVEPGENMEDAVIREVLEETGVQTAFKCLIGFRHGHGYAFNCSDIYMVAYLKPNTFDIEKCKREIAECKWMKLDEYMHHPEVHTNNKVIATKVGEFLQHRMGMTKEYHLHPITKKPVCIYSISRVEAESLTK